MSKKQPTVLNQIVAELQTDSLRQRMLDTFNRASDRGDFYHIKTREFVANGGVEIRMAVRAAASVIKPSLYMGVGVRYGWSDAQAISEMSDLGIAILVDKWEEDYAGLPTRGSGYAYDQIVQMAGEKIPSVTCVNADSHIVLPFICKRLKIDLAVIDGDHRATGLWADICDIFPAINVGGAVVIDDLYPTAHEHQLHLPPLKLGDRRPYPLLNVYSLTDLWLTLPQEFPEFVYWDNHEVAQPFGTAPVGIAVRVS